MKQRAHSPLDAKAERSRFLEVNPGAPMRAAVCISLAATLLLGVPTQVRAQVADAPQARDSAKVVLIHQLLSITHAVDLAIAAAEATVPAQRAANSRIPAVFWDRFLEEVRKSRTDLENIFVDVYDRHFTADELSQLIAFDKTPIGQKMLAEMPAIMQESRQAGQKWGGRVGAAVAVQLQSEGVEITP